MSSPGLWIVWLLVSLRLHHHRIRHCFSPGRERAGMSLDLFCPFCLGREPCALSDGIVDSATLFEASPGPAEGASKGAACTVDMSSVGNALCPLF